MEKKINVIKTGDTWDACGCLCIDDYLAMLSPDKDEAFAVLNRLLWYLQENDVVDFREDMLDELFNAPEV